MGGLRPTAEAFLSHTATVMLLVLVASSMGLLIGACVTQVKRAQTVASVLMLAVMLTVGGLVLLLLLLLVFIMIYLRRVKM
jgi:ABC-type Na+ efflux pump permease subunit